RSWAELTEPGLRHLTFHEVLERLDDGLDPLADLFIEPPVALANAVGAPTPPRPGDSLRVVGGQPRGTGRTRVARRLAPAGRPVPELPAGLSGPVTVELAKAEETVPGPRAMPGGSWYELKWDGYRLATVQGAHGARLWSRNGTDLTERFPEITSAVTAVLPLGTVLDGEVVIWNGDRLEFDRLQARLAGGADRIARQVSETPASYVVFDILALNGDDLRSRQFRERRATLVDLAASWRPPLQVSPLTDDITSAQQWLTEYRPAGIEGLVIKGADTRYEPGQRRWIKVKHRTTEEALIGAVIGPLAAPESIVVGRYTTNGQLVIVGRSVPLSAAQAASLATVLEPARPGHPWPDTVISSRFGNGKDRVRLTKVEPTVVAEVSVDAARQAGVYRHSVRYLRHRPELHPMDVPRLSARARIGE
ncbi:MAG: ATP-dependent DNA ligase, partial [Nakamurella sp.]